MKKHIHIIIAILFFIFATVVDKNQSYFSGEDIIDIDKFEDVLHQKEKQYISIIDSIAGILDDVNFNFSTSKYNIFNEDELEDLKKQGFSFIIYKNDTLAYWTDNLFDVDYVFNSNQFSNDQCVFVPNYWLDYRIKEVREFKIIGAFRIKSKYDINNKYLQNNFNEDLKLPKTFKISLIPLSYGIDVMSSENEYLLSLIPDNNVFVDFKLDWLVGVFLFIGFFFLLLYLNQILLKQYKGKRVELKLFLIFLFIILLRYLIIKFNVPLILYSQSFFDSEYYAASGFLGSLGDLYLNLLIIILLVFHFFKVLDKNKLKQFVVNNIPFFSIISALISSFVFLYGFEFIGSFVINSTAPLSIFNVLDLNWYSVIGFMNISLIIFVVFITLYKSLEFVKNISKPKYTLIYSFVGYILSLLLFFLTFKSVDIFSIIIALLTIAVVLFYILKKKISSPYFMGLIILLASLSFTKVLITALNDKNEANFSNTVMRLTNANDDVAELLLEDIVPKIQTDEALMGYILDHFNIINVEHEIEKFLHRRYFKTYWNKYDLQVKICSDKIDDQDRNLYVCNSKYSEITETYGTKLENENTYFVSYNNGKTEYWINLDYESAIDTCRLYITLTPKLYPTNIGYPELLLDDKVDVENIPNYSYAKYENNEISVKVGDYNYPINGERLISKSRGNKIVVSEKNFKHIIYILDEVDFDDYIILTYQRITFINIIITFAYIYLFYVILTVFILLVINFKSVIKIKNLNFRTKLILSMFSVLTISFSLVASFTIYLNKKQFNNTHQDEVINKLQQISISLEQDYYLNDTIFSVPDDVLNAKLRSLTEIFGTDVNLYNDEGFLIATSRPEIYGLYLVAQRVSALALNEVETYNKVKFILNEQINKLKYQSAYYQLLDDDNNLLAIVNMPYFIKPDELKSEISNLIVSIVNIYVVLFVISMIISVLISEQIISPLIILQSKFNKLELGKQYEKIDYIRNDEIGQLVEEYNLMVDKLKESIEKLSKTERESAWRDMAKQIAHEIKNPLTPMKLSIQLLMRSWENQDENFDQRIRDVSSTLINQIETLRRIAEEFSDFAKMPKPHEVVFNLADKIEEICKLYENTENVEVIHRLHNYKQALIFADEKQISRALINLIKNAIQAIADGVLGKIIIDLDIYADKALVKIIDNGTGIPEDAKSKLFVPSFTTKSSGMGLGLAMVKNIIDNAKGKISFKSKVGEGTTFIIEFPLHKEK